MKRGFSIRHWKRQFLLVGIMVACLVSGWLIMDKYECLITENIENTFQITLALYDARSQKPIPNELTICVNDDSDTEKKETVKVETDDEGVAIYNLNEGKYIVYLNIEGYYEKSVNILVDEGISIFPIYLIPCLQNDSAYVIAEWNGVSDIDLCIYSEQEGRCIAQQMISEEDGEENFVLRDNSIGTYEIAYLENFNKDNYIIFLKEYDKSTEKPLEESMPQDIKISIYNVEGLWYSETVTLRNLEASDEIKLYEWGAINEGAIESRNIYIEDLTDYKWAARNKYDIVSWIDESKIQIEEIYIYNEGGIIEQITRAIFDEKGNLLAESVYNSEGVCTSENKYESKYDENEKLVMESEEHYADGTLEYRREVTYDAYGNSISSYVYNPDGSVKEGGWSIIQYDGNGNILVKELYRVGMEQPYYKYEYTYDEDGHRIFFSEYGRNGLFERKVNQEYDESGQVRRVQIELYNEAIMEYVDDDTYEIYGEQPYIEVLEYDADGNQIGFYVYDKEGMLESWWEAEYDANGKELFKRYYDCELLDFWIESQYDNNGNLIVQYIYEDEDKTLRASEHHEYTAEGRREILYTYAADGEKPEDMEIREYDMKDNIILHARTYDLETWLFWNEWVYDEKGNEISYSHFVGEKVLEYRREMEYDSMNNETLNRLYRSDGTIREIINKYVYDSAAGRVTMYQYIDGVKTEKKTTLYYP